MSVAEALQPFIIRDPGVPLTQWPDGSVRVGGTRLLLDLVVGGFRMGQSPEEFAELHGGGVRPDAIHAVFGYYVRHRDEVDAYVRAGEMAGEEAYQKILALPGHAEALARLTARMEAERARRAERDASRTD